MASASLSAETRSETGKGVARKLRAAGIPVRSVLAHPGVVVTNLQNSGPTGLSAGDATQQGVRCTRTFNINSLDDAWPVNFGTSDCVNTNLFNFWITTYHQ